jgi:hypothetical protein
MRGVVHVRARMPLTALRYELDEWQQRVAQAVSFFFTQALLPQHRAHGCALQSNGVDAYVHERCVSQDIRNSTDPMRYETDIEKHAMRASRHVAPQGMSPLSG